MNFEIRPEWSLKNRKGTAVSLPVLLQLLTVIRDHGSISSAAASANLSYRHAWGMLRDFEQEFSAPLLEKSRGKGTTLTPLAEKLIWADKRITARLSPILESFASELEIILTSVSSALRITASHGFAVDTLIKQLATVHVPVEINYRNSLEAVVALAHGECDMAGFHVPVGEFKQAARPYLKWLNPKQHALIHLAYRQQGLFIAKGNPKKIGGLKDLKRKNLRFINRQNGSGTRILLDLLLAKEKISPKQIADYENVEYTHAAVAAYVASGMADAGFGVETAAKKFDLDFIPMASEKYFFACKANALEQGLVKPALNIMQSQTFHDAINALAGYDGLASGSIVSFEETFL
ncbi:MAG: substrate-binding domain-containing protein [Gallionella sp.]